MYCDMFMIFNPIIVDTGPKWWTYRPSIQQTDIAIITNTGMLILTGNDGNNSKQWSGAASSILHSVSQSKTHASQNPPPTVFVHEVNCLEIREKKHNDCGVCNT